MKGYQIITAAISTSLQKEFKSINLINWKMKVMNAIGWKKYCHLNIVVCSECSIPLLNVLWEISENSRRCPAWILKTLEKIQIFLNRFFSICYPYGIHGFPKKKTANLVQPFGQHVQTFSSHFVKAVSSDRF